TDYQQTQPTTSSSTGNSSSSVVPAGGVEVDSSAYPVRPAAAETAVGNRYEVDQAGGVQEPNRF
ncbi:MAG: hypothetical protein KDA42_09040, partial [Planctomycetales bacterium]|nr:hypothetical protein [Planctomycetales bacterium]